MLPRLVGTEARCVPRTNGAEQNAIIVVAAWPSRRDTGAQSGHGLCTRVFHGDAPVMRRACAAPRAELVEEAACEQACPSLPYPDPAAPQAELVEEEVFENERFLPLRGWGARGHLLPGERGRFSNRAGTRSWPDFPDVQLPEGGAPALTHTLTLTQRWRPALRLLLPWPRQELLPSAGKRPESGSGVGVNMRWER